MNIEGLKYAKIISHVPPIEPKTNLNIVLPVEQILKEYRYQFCQDEVESIFKTVEKPNEFWEIVKEKYDIERFNESYPPPKSYVIKLNLSWNIMIFVCHNQIVKIVNGNHNFPLEYKYFYYWKKNVLKHYEKKIPPKFFIEEFIGYNLKVFEVYCIYGKPRVLSVYYETSVSYENNYLVYLNEADPEAEQEAVAEEKPKEYTFTQKLITGSHLIQGAKPLDFKLDKKICKQICIYAQEFAHYFEFMRVDFYYHKNDIYFSECTFKPGALKKIKWMQIS